MDRWNIRRSVEALVALTLLLAGIAPAAAQEPAYGQAAAEIAERIASAFPKVTGQVIGLEQERVLIDLGSKDKVIPGLEMQVYREGEVFKHPYTGQVLGKLDRDVGRLRILEVHENFSVAEAIQQAEGTVVQQGDHVRVTTARVILALPSVDVTDVAGANPRSVTRDLLNALVKTGRFEVMTDQRIREALAKEKITNPEFSDPAVLNALWKQLRVSAVLRAKLSLLEKAVQWDVQVVSTVRGDSITLASAEVKGAAPQPGVASSRGEGSGTGGSSRVDQIALRSQNLPFKGQAMAVGDFTGDGTMKVAISDGQGVHIYELEKGGLKELWSTTGATTDNVIALDAADINGSGTAEIFVSNATKDGPRSYVLEYRDGKFVKIWDEVPLYFRVLPDASNTPRLYAQAGGDAGVPFNGPVRQYTWQGKQYVPGPPVTLPKAFNSIYGFALADLDGKGVPDILVLDRLDHLRVFDPVGSEIFRSSDRYGGSELVLEWYPDRAGPATHTGIEANRQILQGRMYFQDLFGDGKKQLIVPQNTPSTGYMFSTRLYDRGKVLGLSWDSLGMQVMWETRELPGYLADYALVDDGSGDRKLVGLVVQTSLFGVVRNHSIVIVLNLRQP
jgi:hypothetical protein